MQIRPSDNLHHLQNILLLSIMDVIQKHCDILTCIFVFKRVKCKCALLSSSFSLYFSIISLLSQITACVDDMYSSSPLFTLHTAVKHHLCRRRWCISDLTGPVIPLLQLQHQSINCTVTGAMSRNTCIVIQFTGIAYEGWSDLVHMPARPESCQV